MRLLAVAAFTPWPAHGGFALRAARLLEGLAHDWDITLVIAARGASEPEHPWSGEGRHRVIGVPTARRLIPVPPPGAGADLRAVTVAVREMIARDRPDAALLWPGTEFLGFGSRFPPFVADRVDAATAERFRGLRRSPGSWWRLPRYALYERRLVRAAFRTLAAGEDDARWLARLSGREVSIVRNGVETAAAPRFELESTMPTVVFTGTLDHPPNVDAARILVRRIWPAVRARVPSARLLIAGRRPGARTLELGRAPGVEILADVPDLAPVLRESWLAVAPMRSGAGVKNKVLEAWAVGRPAVMTRMGANGLAMTPALASLVTDRWPEFATLVVELLEDPNRRRSLGLEAQEVARRSHRWEETVREVSELLRAAAGQPG